MTDHPLASLDSALTALPSGPFTADETAILDASGMPLCHTGSSEVADALTTLLNSAHALTGRMHRRDALRQATPEEPLTNFARLTATYTAEVEKQAAWARENPELAAERSARFALEEQRRAAQEKVHEREALRQRAIARNCPEHAPLIAALSPRETPALEAVRTAVRWYRQHRLGCIVVLAGDPDGGKSTALIRAVMRFNGTAHYITASKLAMIPENDWSANREAREALLEAELLVIDECGRETSRHAGPRISSVILERYDLGLPTFAATNMGATAFAKRYFAAAGVFEMDKDTGKHIRDAQGDLIPVPDPRIVSRLGTEQKVNGLQWWWPLEPVNLRSVPVTP